jgi:hypothetical protein
MRYHVTCAHLIAIAVNATISTAAMSNTQIRRRCTAFMTSHAMHAIRERLTGSAATSGVRGLASLDGSGLKVFTGWDCDTAATSY